MKTRHYHLLWAWGYVLLCIFFIVIAFVNTLDTLGLVFFVLFLALFSYLSFVNFKAAAAADDTVLSFGPPPDTPVNQQIKYYQRMVVIGVVAVTILSVWVIYDLNQLESGQADSVRIVEPIAILYNTAGYWPAVLALPALGILVLVSGLKKINGLKNKA